MIRSFLPVGQGAFYLEQFTIGATKANVIYDCGSLTDIHIVEKEIRRNFEKNEVIDAVFISHFDRDHINGLSYLLQYCHVSKLFFPLVTEESQKLILLQDLITNSSSAPDFFTAFITNPYNAFEMIALNYSPRLYQIGETTERTETIKWNNIDALYIESGRNVSDIVFDSKDEKISWMYVPFNFRETEKLASLKNALQNKLGKAYSCEELSELVKNDPQKLSDLAETYKYVPGSFNANSMTLLSASTDNKIVQSPFIQPCKRGSCYTSCYNPCCYDFANGCLYTGDFDAHGNQKWDDLSKAYARYDRNIGCVQIPHHGSWRNYNHQLLTIGDCMYYIISAGERNKYRHPHGSVIRDILVSHKYPIIVTEYSGNAAYFIVNYL